MRKKISKLVPFQVKLLISIVLYSVFRIRMLLNNSVPKVKTQKDTVEYIIKNRVSVSRFGDGEFKWMFQNRESGNFEINSPDLAIALKKTIAMTDDRLIICIPDIFSGLSKFNKEAIKYWGICLGINGMKWLSALNKNRVYFNAQITRPYMDFKDKSNVGDRFLLLKRIWENRDVLIVEGSQTRFGIGNDLLSKARSVKRILAPPTNAFEKYDDIKNEIIKTINHDKDTLVLLSLGPTATILAADLSKKDIQSIDTGHLDIEYSWYLMKSQRKVAVTGKYVGEAPSGTCNVDNINDKNLNHIYESEIVGIIK
ncbi:hypothetical protein NBRC111452_2264 [Companilactobacillus farciminis]|jgi:glycosyltransferase family protein|uniref:GT-D fold domain-containing glycosyltransferase n=1 Tax=Companilactobacillus pabuli TaxID=2714036 RepID=UPI0006EE293E|nr:hypothetical protein NBRC111452_2264 [Companilactobacillus farciminis]